MSDSDVYYVVIHCAMFCECRWLIDKMSDVKLVSVGNFSFYEGCYEGVNIVVCVSGVGTINTAGCVMYLINNYKVRCIINIGLVGGCDKMIHKGSMIVGKRALNINSYKTGYLKEGDGSDYRGWELISFGEGVDELKYFDCNERLLNIYYKMSGLVKGNCFVGNIGSGDCWNSEVDRILFLGNKYDLICFDMECISLYLLCDMFGIEAISFKIVSDNIILGEEYDRELMMFISSFLDSYIRAV